MLPYAKIAILELFFFLYLKLLDEQTNITQNKDI